MKTKEVEVKVTVKVVENTDIAKINGWMKKDLDENWVVLGVSTRDVKPECSTVARCSGCGDLQDCKDRQC